MLQRNIQHLVHIFIRNCVRGAFIYNLAIHETCDGITSDWKKGSILFPGGNSHNFSSTVSVEFGDNLHRWCNVH